MEPSILPSDCGMMKAPALGRLIASCPYGSCRDSCLSGRGGTGSDFQPAMVRAQFPGLRGVGNAVPAIFAPQHFLNDALPLSVQQDPRSS
jgi:hypothetical protein